MKPKLLELFSGQGTISKTFAENGWDVYRVDWSDKVEAELHTDVGALTANDVIALCGGVPTAIWASPQCTTYSIATHRHRTKKEGLAPKTELAQHDDEINVKLWALIDELVARGTRVYWVENPRGRYRSMPFVENRIRHTVTYCNYGRRGNANGYNHVFINKPTDLFSNIATPGLLPPCSISYAGHIHGNSKLADKRDYLNRGEIPEALRQHIVEITNRVIDEPINH